MRFLRHPTPTEAAYVLVVAVLAAWGFVTGSTALILAATALALPAGVVAIVGYYVLYGLLGVVPGANPDSASGSSCSSGCTIRRPTKRHRSLASR